MPHRRRPARLHLLLVSVLLAITAPTARAQGVGRVLDIDGSAISSAMGGASAAVFWSAEPNYWANPALLGYYRGVRYQYARSRLVPGIAEDVLLTSHRITLTAYGLGLELAGRPLESLGGTKLEYGVRTNVDEGGTELGPFESREDVKTWGVGLSLSELLRSVAPGSPASDFARYFDIAGGYAQKAVDIRLAPTSLQGRASATGRDLGLLVRGGIDAFVPFNGTRLPFRLDASLGGSVLNYNHDAFVFVNEDQASRPSRMTRLGGAGRFAIGPPAARSGSARTPLVTALLRGFDPLFSIGLAYDDERVDAGSWRADGYHVRHVGGEVAILNVLAVRYGHVTDRLGEIDGSTWGLGIGLPVADVAGLRYDYGRYPQATRLPQVTLHSASVFVDPIALLRLMK